MNGDATTMSTATLAAAPEAGTGTGTTTTMVRYTVKPDRVEENEALVRAVYGELAETAPDGLRYATFLLDDGVTFVHIATMDSTDAENPLRATPAFRAFLEGLEERTEAPMVRMAARPVGSYRFLAE